MLKKALKTSKTLITNDLKQKMLAKNNKRKTIINFGQIHLKNIN